MRNQMSVVIILSSIVLLVLGTVNGIKIGEIEILSISQIIEKNKELNGKINEASQITSKDFEENKQKLKATYTDYKTQKQTYSDKTSITSEIDEEIFETKQYSISYLWKVLGKYATNRELVLGIEVKKSNIGTSIYDLNFTVSGEYTKICKFILDIENDSDLSFRIYNFKMEGKEDSITSTFTVRNVNIDPSSIS